jgi:hypothetical protein
MILSVSAVSAADLNHTDSSVSIDDSLLFSDVDNVNIENQILSDGQGILRIFKRR